MDTKPKATKVPRKKAAKTAETQKEQSARFIKAAREAGIDETGNTFERAMSRLAGSQRVLSKGDS